MLLRRFLFACVAGAALLCAQAPTAPVISARGVTNFFTQEPAPGIIGLGGLVQIGGLNLGPPEGITATDLPWPTRLGDTTVVIGGKPAPLYSVSPGTILAQVPVDANIGLVSVIVRRGGVSSPPAKVTVAAMAPPFRTADDSGAGLPWGKITAQTIAIAATGLGPTEPKLGSGEPGPAGTPVVPTADISAYVGGLRAKVTTTASTTRPAEFDVNITVPAGARRGDLITLFAGRQAANATVFAPMTDPDVLFVPLPASPPTVIALSDTGVNGSYLLATGNRDADGCYPALGVDVRARTIAAIPDCLTSVNANIQPLAIPANGDSIAALIGPPAGDAQTGISSTVKIFSGAGAPIQVDLPSAASTLTATANGFVATLPGKPVQIATIDPDTGELQTSTPAVGAAAGAGSGAGAGAGGAAPAPTVDIDGLKHVYAFANVGQNRIAVISGDDALKPTKAAFAIVNPAGAVTFSKQFPTGWLPLLTAEAPARPNQTAPPAVPTDPATFDAATRLFYVLARATDASDNTVKDAFVTFGLADTTDPNIVAFPDGWFAASCTADIRLFALDLVGQVALAGSKVAETEFKTNCAATAFLTLDFSAGTMTAIPLNDQGQIRVPTTRTDVSMALMNNYVYGVKLDSTRATTSDTLYVLDGVNGNAVTMPVPAAVTAFTNATLLEIPEINSLLVQTFDKLAGDQGFVLFNLDAQTAKNLPLPEGFASVGPPAGAAPASANAVTAARVIIANAQANTISAVAYTNNRQVGILVIRIP